MYSYYWIAATDVLGHDCELRLSVSHYNDGAQKHTVIGNIVLRAVPGLLLVNDVRMSVALEPGLTEQQVREQVEQLIATEHLRSRAAHILELLEAAL